MTTRIQETPAALSGATFPMSIPSEERRLKMQEQIFAWVEENNLPMEGEVRFTERTLVSIGLVNVYAAFYPDWFPRLIEEFDGNSEAARVAWALGQRPNGYPEEGKK